MIHPIVTVRQWWSGGEKSPPPGAGSVSQQIGVEAARHPASRRGSSISARPGFPARLFILPAHSVEFSIKPPTASAILPPSSITTVNGLIRNFSPRPIAWPAAWPRWAFDMAIVSCWRCRTVLNMPSAFLQSKNWRGGGQCRAIDRAR